MPVEFRDYYQILGVSRGERTRFWKELSRVSHFNPGQINKRHFEETMKMFGNSIEKPVTTVQLFEPDARAVYTLEQVASLTQLPRRLIAVYFKHGLVSPVMDPACSGWYFNDEAIRILRRIDYLRTTCGLNLVGIKIIMELAREVERLREELNFRRRQWQSQ